MIEALLGIAVVSGIAALFWRFIRPTNPQVAPLETSVDDAEMISARRNARESIANFISLYKLHPESSVLKVRRIQPVNATSG
jgi:hypothetical protein